MLNGSRAKADRLVTTHCGHKWPGSKIATEDMQAHIDIVVNGKGSMPPFGSMLSMKDMAAVITYERNAWGNDTGDLVQPKDVNAVMNGQ